MIIKPEGHAFGEEIDVSRMVIQAGNVSERLAAGLGEVFGAAHTNLFECLQAVGYESGRDAEETFLTPFARRFISKSV
jgi:hypothetical protein